MKQSFAIFSYILIGAAAAGVGIGFFLFQANQDRAELVAQKIEAEKQAEELLAASNRIAEEANQKIEQASDEVNKTRERLKILEEEQAMIKKADILTRASRTQYWEEILHLPLGFTVRIPRTSEEITNVTSTLVVGPRRNYEEPWVELNEWSQDKEQELTARLKDPKELLYLVDGQLIVGQKGILDDGANAFVFRVQSGGASTLVIWVKEDSGFDDDDVIDMISSFTFRS